MPSAARLEPRKQPQQRRSRDMTDLILDATARILIATGGGEGFNTNTIAGRAGVSVGSLYQYFPSKEALIAALAKRHAQAMNTQLLRVARRLEGGSLDEVVGGMIDALIAAHRVEPELHAILVQWSAIHAGGEDSPAEVDGRRLVRGLLGAHLPDLSPRAVEEAALVASTVVHETIHAAVRLRPQSLRSGAIAAALRVMVMAYLADCAGGRKQRGGAAGEQGKPGDDGGYE